MVGLADENGKTYECNYGTYNKDEGFIFNRNVREVTENGGWRKFISMLFHDDMWKLQQDIKKMTLEDVEKALGYKVQIVDPEPKNEPISQKSKDEVDDIVDFWKRLFGSEY
jgi:hypothetical protein